MRREKRRSKGSFLARAAPQLPEQHSTWQHQRRTRQRMKVRIKSSARARNTTLAPIFWGTYRVAGRRRGEKRAGCVSGAPDSQVSIPPDGSTPPQPWAANLWDEVCPEVGNASSDNVAAAGGGIDERDDDCGRRAQAQEGQGLRARAESRKHVCLRWTGADERVHRRQARGPPPAPWLWVQAGWCRELRRPEGGGKASFERDELHDQQVNLEATTGARGPCVGDEHGRTFHLAAGQTSMPSVLCAPAPAASRSTLQDVRRTSAAAPSERPQRVRAMVLAKNGLAGAQKRAGYPWAGDLQRVNGVCRGL
jgi:hypothetical protein